MEEWEQIKNDIDHLNHGLKIKYFQDAKKQNPDQPEVYLSLAGARDPWVGEQEQGELRYKLLD